MNLGSASDVDLSEAARLLKQGVGAVGTGIQNQQVPPPMMLMQQAVAMQQFQFQQALLMQQVMATQQAAARAATVKSAQEMAAARAAEISKLLKGNEPDVEEEKKSPVRSMSRTPSRSRSLSRSKSRSPIRYRRDRSASRSPIRYRRDTRPSPISREYFGYRGRSRRGFYRGRGEYAWNPSYRRDWDRERDHYPSRSRRSRSRSRSRVRRRSHTRSRSPRSRRDRSGTPPRYYRDERRSGRGSRRSRSAEARPTPSRSSRSRSRSRSRSVSLHLENGSQSPVRKSRDLRSNGETKHPENMNLVPSDIRSTLMSSPDARGNLEKDHPDDITGEKELALEKLKTGLKGKDEGSVSPVRSLSVSLSPPSRKDGEGLEGGRKTNDWKKAVLRDTLAKRTDELTPLAEPPHSNITSAAGVEGGESSSVALLEPEIDIKGAFRSKGGDFHAKGRYVKKEYDRTESSSDESDGNKEVDDWRDDIKANELEKIKRMESKREMERRESERKSLPVQVVVQEEVKDHGMTLLEHLGRGTGKLSVESPFAAEGQGDAIAAAKTGKGTPNSDVLPMETTYSAETRVDGSKKALLKEVILDRVSTGNGEGNLEMEEETGDITNEKSIESADVLDREGDSEVVFEGPMLPYEEDIDLEINGPFKEGDDFYRDVGKSPGSSKGEDSAEQIGAEQPPSFAGEEVVENLKGKDNSRYKDKVRLKQEDELYDTRKSKENSRSRERTRRRDDEIDQERRKDKHRKHKRRHRRDEDTEKEDDDDDERRDVDGDKDKEERRHSRSKKHRSGRDHKEDKREKKRRRHKHRGKSPSESPDKESLVAEVEGAEDGDQVADRVHKKKSSSRGNKRKDVSKSPTLASGSGSD